MITLGGTEGLIDFMMALIEHGDEVVLIKPLYDCYLSMLKWVGGISKLARTKPPN